MDLLKATAAIDAVLPYILKALSTRGPLQLKGGSTVEVKCNL